MAHIAKPRCRGKVTRFSPRESAIIEIRCIKKVKTKDGLCKECAKGKKNA